ncbi:MAG: hypothetical protein ABI673_08200 [Novosphingobium sp.]
MKNFLPLLAALTLSSCVTYHTRDDGIARARIGETVRVAGLQVSPVKMLEDSRCPQGVQCVWAGQVRISATISSETQELTLGQPTTVEDGQLTMVEAYPDPRKDRTVYPEEYRFGFTFARGK